MRPDSVRKTLLMTAVAALALVLCAVPAHAEPDPECVDECFAQWQEDVADCEDALEQRLLELEAEAQACYEQHSDLLELGKCLSQVDAKRYRAHSDYRRCLSEAHTAGWNCYRNCPPASPSAP